MVRLGDVVFHQKGYAFQSESYQSSGVKLIRVSDMTDDAVNLSNCVYVSEEIAERFSKYILRSNDIVLTTVGSRPPTYSSMVGKTVRIPHDADGALLNQNSVKLIPNEDTILSDYLYNVLKTRRFIFGHIIRIATGNANQASISLQDLFAFTFPLAPLAEQRKIAAILGTWDAAIAKAEQLVAALKARKRALMQRLLTGEVRFGSKSIGFTETPFGHVPKDWEVTQFDKVFAMSSGATPTRTRPEYFQGSILWVTSGELNYSLIIDTMEKISQEAIQRTGLKIHPEGTFLLAITGLEAAGTRGRCGILGRPATVNQSCMAFESNEYVDTKYLFYFYNLFSERIAFRYAQGTKQQSLPKKIIGMTPIFFPSLHEQNLIVSVLSKVDEEIEVVSRELELLYQQKRGLMQRLLTGEVRV
jgi:type I restriction enzyme, S subunit